MLETTAEFQSSATRVIDSRPASVRAAEKHITIDKIEDRLNPFFIKYGIVERSQQIHIYRVVSRVIKARGEVMPTEEELAYHFHFWSQRLVNNPNTKLRWDDVSQILYKHGDAKNTLIFPLPTLAPRFGVSTNVAKAFDRLVANFPDVIAEFERVRNQVETVLADGTLFIATNHLTWPNLPIIARALTRAYGIPPERLYMILGPALTTYEQGFRAPLALSNLLKTIPETQNGVIPGQEQLVAAIRKQLIRELRTICGQPGNIVIYAPVGTRDVYNQKDGTIGMKKPAATSIRLPKAFNCSVLPIGTNERDIFDEKGEIKQGNEYLRIGEIFKPSKYGEEIMPAVASLIVDASGNQIGRLLDEPA